MNKLLILLKQVCAYIIRKIGYNKDKVTYFENFLPNLFIKYKLDYMFFWGYTIGQLLHSEIFSDSGNSRVILSTMIGDGSKGEGAKVFRNLFEQNNRNLDLKLISAFLGGTGHNLINSHINYYRGFLYIASQNYKLNCYYEAHFFEKITDSIGSDFFYKNILEVFGQPCGILIILPQFDSFSNIVGHVELFLVHKDANSPHMDNISAIDKKQIQGITYIFEDFIRLFDNDAKVFREKLLEYYQKKFPDNKKFWVGPQGTFALIFLCLFNKEKVFSKIPICL
jgi:hypothetical protein